MEAVDNSTSRSTTVTTVRGIAEDMQAVHDLGYSFSEAFRFGCRSLIGKVESDIDTMKAELKELQRDRKEADIRINFLKSELAKNEAETQAEAQASHEQFENIVTQFENLVFSVGVEKRSKPMKFLADLHPILTKDLVMKIYADATPEGKTAPSVDNIRAQIEKYLM